MASHRENQIRKNRLTTAHLLSFAVIGALGIPFDAFAQNLFPASGNVGIGTTSPYSLLSVGSSSPFQVNANGVVTSPAFFAATDSMLTLASGDASHEMFFKNGPAGPIMLIVGGTNAAIEPQATLLLTGGTWGSGALTNAQAPLFQLTSFEGSTTSAASAFGAFLQQVDESSCTGHVCAGITENLILNGSSEIGDREGAAINIGISKPTANTVGQEYVGVNSNCNLLATDAGGTSSCAGNRMLSHIGQDINDSNGGNVGQEIDTYVESGVTLTDRVGEQVVDAVGPTYGIQGTRDDVALSLNNQYEPAENLGFRYGLEFGRWGGWFPIATGGTLIYGQGSAGTRFNVANGIDWHLGTFTGNAYNDGHVVITGSGRIGIGTASPQASLDVAGMIQLTANSSQPSACQENIDGNVARTSRHTLCVCNGGASDWVSLKDGVTACQW